MTFDALLNLVSSGKAPRVSVDSRLVQDGDIFVAVAGTVYDGHAFITQAIAKGAKYIVCQGYGRETTEDRRQRKYEIVLVGDSAEAAALLAQAARGNPASKLINLAVTGTNGKTTTAYLVRSVMQTAGHKCGLIGTIIYDTGSAICQASLTTPDSLAIAEAQQQMVNAGAKYMVIEASSHALSQNRLAGIEFKAAAFTNLTGDHLDYHKTKESYLAAKTRLFSGLSPNATAVLNKQSPEARHIAEKTKAKVLWYAVDEPADISAHIESMDINGTTFALQYSRQSSIVNCQSSIVNTPLLGRHNVSNHLAAAGLCLAAGLDVETIAAGLSALKGVPGRLEKVEYSGVREQGAGIRNQVASDERRAMSHVLIDYAHTDDALKNVLTTLKPLCKGRLIVVFGCGGDRDRTKRPRMARVAEQLADVVIVTSDNPRTEKPQAIIDEIVAGFETTDYRGLTQIRNEQHLWSKSVRTPARRESKSVVIEPDRRKAIELAITAAGKDDILLIAGKGHETYQIIGTQKFAFSDKQVALECLRKYQV
jgi:UDP-N-acetylmuramoyl-L-alanyl-D-glutamate--2,6-diaminopimelate ligase